MGFIFSAQEIVERSRGLTFDDVLLMPRHSEMSSRKAPQLGTFINSRVSKLPDLLFKFSLVPSIYKAFREKE